MAYGYKGKGTLQHILTDANGLPIAHSITPANGNEREEVCNLLERIEPLLKPLKERKIIPILEADKGYDCAKVRIFAINHKIVPDIPYRKGSEPEEKRDEKVGWKSMRWVVERCHAWLQKKFRRYAVRWERLPRMWKAVVNSCMIIFWIQKLVG